MKIFLFFSVDMEILLRYNSFVREERRSSLKSSCSEEYSKALKVNEALHAKENRSLRSKRDANWFFNFMFQTSRVK